MKTPFRFCRKGAFSSGVKTWEKKARRWQRGKENYQKLFAPTGRAHARSELLAPSVLKISGVKFLALFALMLASAAPLRADDLAAQVHAELNLARTAPRQYAQIVASRALGHRHIEGDRVVEEAVRFLEKARPLPPFMRSEGLSASALAHVLDLGPSGGRGHSGSDGSTPWKRMARFGRWSGHAAENISYGERDARGIVVALIVDDGTRDRLHRQNIFSRDLFCVGIASGPHAGCGTMCVMDFAEAFAEAGPRVAMGAK